MTSRKIFFANMEDVAGDKTEHCKEKSKDEQTQFLMVNYEEQLAHEFEDARDELFKQITSLATKLSLLWEIVRAMIVFFIPVITGIGLSFLSKSYLPVSVALFASTIFNGITIGLVFLNLVPLNEAVTNYLDSRVYTPNFVNCTCKKCHDRNNCSNEQREGKGSAKSNCDSTSEQQENTTKVPTDNDTGIKADENDDGPKIRNATKEHSKSENTSQDSNISD